MPNFTFRKRKILEQLAIPDTEYTDLSPKGSVDEGVRELCEEINSQEGLVTTSSCAGRVAVFLEGGGSKAEGGEGDEDAAAAAPTVASSGGKGGGGRWLYVSHDPVDERKLEGKGEVFKLFGIEESEGENSSLEAASSPPLRFVHFKFEPMILHILTSSLATAQQALSAAQTSGFRESGISSITGPDPTPMVAVRTQGLALDSIIGYEDPHGRMISTVSESYLRTLVKIANQRFAVNTERKERFRRAFLHSSQSDSKPTDWEPADVRRERKRAEGLRRREEMRKKGAGGNATNGGVEDDEDYSTGLLPLDPP